MWKRAGLWLGIVLVVATAVVWLDPTRVLWGLLRRESFYQGRPTSYWRGLLITRIHSPSDDSATTPEKNFWGKSKPAGTVSGQEVFALQPRWGAALDPTTIPVLLELLNDEDDQVCFFACGALAAHGPEAVGAAPTLRKMMRHDNLYRRRNGAHALAAIGVGSRDAIPELIQALKEDDSWVNYYAATALGKCGREAREAIPALRELLRSDRAKVSYLGSRKEEDPLRHPNDTVGYAAGWALQQLDPDSNQVGRP